MSLSNTSQEVVIESSGSTRLDVIKFKFEWIINLGIYENNGITTYSITSPTFKVLENKSEFYLKVKNSQKSQQCICVYLHCNTKVTQGIYVKYKLTFNGDIKNAHNCGPSILMDNGSCHTRDSRGEPLSQIFKASIDFLTILCEGVCTVDPINTDTISKTSKFEIKESHCCSCNYYINLFKEENSDITLCVSGKVFKAHKIILSAQSSVFRAMFDHQLEEAQNNQVIITDIDDEVFSEMLSFMYTGKLQNLDKVGLKLLAAADKYALEGLKMICAKELCSKLSVENVVEIYKIADLHSAKEMKAYAVDFMNKYMNSRFMTEEWVSMSQTNGDLIVEVFEALKEHKK